MAIWSIVEIISFNQLISFCDYFYEIYPNKLYNESIKDNLHNVRFLRNASAHNNCILLLKSRDAKQQKTTVQFLVQNDIGKHDIQKGFLKNHTINDFITSLIVFDKLCVSDNFKRNYFKDLEYFFTNRMLKNKTYYKNNQLLTDSYKFVLKSVEFFKNKYDANIS